MSKSQFDRGLSFALRLLSYCARSEHELHNRLRRKGFSEEIVKQIIVKLKEYGYIDDMEFARQWIEARCRLKPCGSYRLARELREKGVSNDIIFHALAEFERNYSLDELCLTAAVRFCEKRTFADSCEKLRKVRAFLMRRGFSHETISRCLRQLDTI